MKIKNSSYNPILEQYNNFSDAEPLNAHFKYESS